MPIFGQTEEKQTTPRIFQITNAEEKVLSKKITVSQLERYAMNTKLVTTLVSVFILAALLLSACGAAEETACLGTAEDAIVDLDCREITVAVENAYLPFNYVDAATGEPGGWDYDALAELCTRLHCTPVFQEASWDGMIQAVADGQYDMAGDGITVTDERKEIVDFSDGYIAIEQRLLVRVGEDRFTTIEEFVANPEWIMGTQVSTTNYETATTYLPEDRIQAYDTFPFAVQALISGDVDAVILDMVVGLGYMGENADKVELVGPGITSEELGFVFPLGSDLVDPINQALAEMIADGTLEEINTRYFGPNFTLTADDIE